MPAFKPSTVLAQKFPRGEAHSIDKEALNELVRSQGVTLVHYRAMACPVGIIDKDDTNRRFHEDHPGCSNGYLYKKVGTVMALFTGNSASPNFQDVGVLDGSTVSATFDDVYDGTENTVYVAPFDRFYLADETILWPHWEILEHNLTGVDKLRFPASRVEHLVDNNGREYRQDQDFVIRGGKIVWIDGRQPGPDPDAGPEHRGRVCTAWYLYQPYWYLQRLTHENRIVQTEDVDGVRKMTRLNMAGVLVREHVFENQQAQDEASEHSDREMRGPRDGSIAPR